MEYNRNATQYFKLDVEAAEPNSHKSIYEMLEEYDGQVTDLEFGDNTRKIRRRIFRCE